MKKRLEFGLVPGTDPGYYYPALRPIGSKKWIPLMGIYTKDQAKRQIARWKAEQKLDVAGLKRKLQSAAKKAEAAEAVLREAKKAYYTAEQQAEQAGALKPKSKQIWKLVGFDTFANEFYSLDGEYKTEKAVNEAAKKRLGLLEKSQPSESSGGQSAFGIQDRVFIETPDGRRYRFGG